MPLIASVCKLHAYSFICNEECDGTLFLWKVLIGLKNPNQDSREVITAGGHWGLIQVSLNVRDIPQMVRNLSPPFFLFCHFQGHVLVPYSTTLIL